MRRRIRELVALMLAVCMICGGIWIGKSAAYAAEVGTVYTDRKSTRLNSSH